MISRDLRLTINNGTAILNEPVTVYMYDRGIQLNITVVEYKYKTSKTSSFIAEQKIYKASAVIKAPDGKVFKYPDVKAEIQDDIVRVLITKEWTDETDETGRYYIQIQLYDDENSRVSLPPFYITEHTAMIVSSSI